MLSDRAKAYITRVATEAGGMGAGRFYDDTDAPCCVWGMAGAPCFVSPDGFGGMVTDGVPETQWLRAELLENALTMSVSDCAAVDAARALNLFRDARVPVAEWAARLPKGMWVDA